PRAGHAAGAGRAGTDDAGDPRGCPRGTRPAARSYRPGRRSLGARRSDRAAARFPVPGAQPRSQYAVLEIGRHRADPHRARAEGGDRAVPRADTEPRMSAPAASEAIHRRGFLLVLSSPSGAGKTTITRRLIERDATLSLSV